MTSRHDRIRIMRCVEMSDDELPVLASVLSVEPPTENRQRRVIAVPDSGTENVTLEQYRDRYKRVGSI